MVRAKFVVQEKIERNDSNGNGFEIRLTAVYDDDENSENGQFFKYTPNAEIRLQTINREASREFFVGSEYYVDFTFVENPPKD